MSYQQMGISYTISAWLEEASRRIYAQFDW